MTILIKDSLLFVHIENLNHKGQKTQHAVQQQFANVL